MPLKNGGLSGASEPRSSVPGATVTLPQQLLKPRTTKRDAVSEKQLRSLRPSAAEDLMEKVELGLLHYAHFRPHQGLGGATPAEMYVGRTPAHLAAIPPPRGRPSDRPTDSSFRVDYLDAERLLPLLVRKAA
jgi:hypothetical protein